MARNCGSAVKFVIRLLIWRRQRAVTEKEKSIDKLIKLFRTGIILHSGVKCDVLICSQVVAALNELQEVYKERRR
jgi:hypothetical protein